MTRTIRNRVVWAVGVGGVLLAGAIGTLWLADTYASGASTHCSLDWWRLWRWPGCAMAAHEAVSFSLLGKVLPMTTADTGQNEETKYVVESRIVRPEDKDGSIIWPQWAETP